MLDIIEGTGGGGTPFRGGFRRGFGRGRGRGEKAREEAPGEQDGGQGDRKVGERKRGN